MKGLRAIGLLASVLAGTLPEAAAPQDAYAKQRAEMLADIAATARATAFETSRPRFSDRVMAAMGRVPRHRLVPPEQVAYAYENRPLPIGHGQTISQPYIVALMTDLLDAKHVGRTVPVVDHRLHPVASLLSERSRPILERSLGVARGRRG